MEPTEQGSGPWHSPVLLEESLEYLAIQPDGIYVDMTAGLGGHTAAMARRLERGFVIGCDLDAESLQIAQANTADAADRIRFFQGQIGRASCRERVEDTEGAG